uniref:Uncharacterized protein n=1 Tax=Populus trichocarpa TaxID=3694 RepID=A0A3N7HFB4_POPTR
MFHHLHLSTQPPPPSSLSTFLVHVSQSSSLSTAPPPIFISHLSTVLTTPHLHLSTFLTAPHHSPPSSSLISQPFSQPPLNIFIFISHLSQPFVKALSTTPPPPSK